MAVEWSGFGPDLLITIDRDVGTPLRAQLEDQLRQAIRSGRLAQDERLPSSRVLAHDLGLSRGLVQESYAQLLAEGYLVTRGGSATRVARAATAVDQRATTREQPRPPTAPRRPVADFAAGVPDLASFPREDWAWAMREICRIAPNTEFDYGDPRGNLRLREVLAAYLRRVRAATATADQVLICSGFAQGLGLVLRVLAERGVTTVGFEDPGTVNTVQTAASWAGVAAVRAAVDGLGMDMTALEESGAGAVVLTPAHQCSTGVVLAPERRLALVAWAQAKGATIIEDEYDAEFRYDRDPVGSMQGLAPEHVVSLGTVSKSLAPTLRLGWIVCPAELVDMVAEVKRVTDRGSPGLDQLALATLMESGRYDKHLRRMRTVYARRRDVLVAALSEHAPRVRITGLAAGFHAVAHLARAESEQSVVDAARERGVWLYGMSSYRSDHAVVPPQLVLGFGNTDERAIRSGIAAIRDVLG
jgi:GntR family transcriptional regulator/MocR family aminotransferase